MSASASSHHGASQADIQHHYDLGNDFYGLWLDESRTYSCALWDGLHDTLQAAQLRKLDHLAQAARARGAERVLDIGCGWGSMLSRLLDSHAVRHGVGLTLSAAQAEWARRRLDAARCEVRVEHWADHEPQDRYDAITSIGAFEHFADYGVSREERLAIYRTFFERCRRWLPSGGRMALQTIAKGANVRLDRQMMRDSLFVVEHIFRGSELPWGSEILQASERRFHLLALRNDAEHYRRTTKAWLGALQANRMSAQRLVGEQMVADYERYLSASAKGFANGHLALLRITMERV